MQDDYPGSRTVSLLLVDDDEVDIRGMKRALDELRVANPLFVAHNGVEALEYLRGENGRSRIQPPYIIVLDLNMPKMNGIEFLAELRKDPELKQSVVFVLTTSRAEEDRSRAYEYNVAGYISKTRPQESLRDAVQLIDMYWTIVQLP